MARIQVTLECTCGSTQFIMPTNPKPTDLIQCRRCGEQGVLGDVMAQAIASVSSHLVAASSANQVPPEEPQG